MMNRTQQAKRITWIGFAVNLLLTAFKIVAGLLGKSTAMFADGIHSLSDFITDLFVLLFMNISGRERDDDHRYGHGKYETFATLLISVMLLAVGIGILWNGVDKVLQVIRGEVLEQPGMLALYAAVVSILFKEVLFHYTKKVGDRIKSDAVIANAWHHRSDAFSSIGTALGIGGAIYLGESWRILDPIAGIVVSFFILTVGVKLGLPSVQELLEQSLPKHTEDEIIQIIEAHPDVKLQHNLKTRKIGDIFAIDVHIKLDRDISFVHSHDVATDIEVALREKFGEKTVTNIHTEPTKL